MNDALYAVIPWASIIRLLAAVTGGVYAFASLVALVLYWKSYPIRRWHRIWLGAGSCIISAFVGLHLWVFPTFYSPPVAGALWIGFVLECIGLAAIVARDARIPGAGD